MLEANEPSRKQHPAKRLYPEIAAGGYARNDGFVDFFLRVRTLLSPRSRVLDFGAGRAAWDNDEQLPTLYRELRDFKGTVGHVAGVDVDPVVLQNTSLDEAHQIEPGGALPFSDATFDLVLADHVLEHISRADAPAVAVELGRVLKPGGWIAARTPNRWGLVATAARLVPNRLHVTVLRWLQPDRLAVDVFPTRYAMNTPRDLRRLFPSPAWTVVTYPHVGVEQYAGQSMLAWRLAALVDRLTPNRFAPNLVVFVRKNDSSAA